MQKNNSLHLISEDSRFNENHYESNNVQKNWKDFGVSKQVGIETLEDKSDSSLEWDEDNDQLVTETNDDKSVINVKFEKNGEDFEIFSPFIPQVKNNKFKDFYSELENEGIDINNCLIIKDKKAFIGYMENLTDKILNVIKEYDRKFIT